MSRNPTGSDSYFLQQVLAPAEDQRAEDRASPQAEAPPGLGAHRQQVRPQKDPRQRAGGVPQSLDSH